MGNAVARAMRKKEEGVVVSTAMQKTVVVRVDRTLRHPVYKKVIRFSKNYKAHDEQNACKVGDHVIIAETRPISKTKRWRIVEVVTAKK